MGDHTPPDREPYQMRTAVLPDGTRALIVEPVIPDDAPPQVREGIARRHLVNSGRPCPCGARAHLPNRAQRRAAPPTRDGASPLIHVRVTHAHDCPAAEDTLTAAIHAWREGGNTHV